MNLEERVQVEAEKEQEMLLMMMEKGSTSSSSQEDEAERSSTTSGGGGGVGGGRRGEVVGSDDYFLGLVGGSLSVLLLEGDDSTRHIITALLRKCNYKVTAVSDGLKAWEILKERPHSINIVLTEVELPSISGINLLSMIMDHESCKNIPVIMMSSNDSINMVFNCMLQGAADFLVKPVRKNELRNLWQHVWRKRTIGDGHGGTKGHNDDSAKNRLEANPCKEKKSSGFLHPVKINMECSEKGSDAEICTWRNSLALQVLPPLLQSSCRRSDAEAESTYKQNSTEPEQIKCGSPLSDSICQNGEERIQPNGSLLGNEINKDEDYSTTLVSEFTLFNGGCMANEQTLEHEHPCALVGATNEDMKPIGSISDNNTTKGNQTCDQSTPKQIIDLIGAINSSGPSGYGLGRNTSSSNNLSDATEVVFHGEDFSCKSSSSPMLELSLRRYPYGIVEKEKKKECSILNHSNSSPFYLYNGRTPVPPLARTACLEGEGEGYYGPSTKQIPDKGFCKSSDVLGCNGTTMSVEDAESPSFGTSSQVENTVKCCPIQVIPVPIPVVGMNSEIGARYHSGMRTIFYPEPSAHLFGSAFYREGQRDVFKSSSCQSDTKDLYVNAGLRDEVCHVASVTGDSVNSSSCHGSASQTESNGLGRISRENNANTKMINSFTAELQKLEEKKSAELHSLNHREAALNKFRLKRKDRCYEKKVRYQSRKRLAEQRPRVKGQFVRHVQPGAILASTEV